MEKTGLFNFLKQNINRYRDAYRFAHMMSGNAPIFSQFGNNIYASDVVQQAVNCIVQEISKLSPTHVRLMNGVDAIPADSKIQDVLNAPNDIMTTSDFLEKITWNLYLNYNSFILPTWNNGTLTGLYPLQPDNVTFLEDASGKVFVQFRFRNGYESDPINATDSAFRMKPAQQRTTEPIPTIKN